MPIQTSCFEKSKFQSTQATNFGRLLSVARTIIKLQPTARAYRIIPLCTRGRSICLQQTETIASQAVSYYCFIPRPPAPCAPPAPYGPGSAPAALAPYLPLGRLHSHRAYR